MYRLIATDIPLDLQGSRLCELYSATRGRFQGVNRYTQGSRDSVRMCYSHTSYIIWGMQVYYWSNVMIQVHEVKSGDNVQGSP